MTVSASTPGSPSSGRGAAGPERAVRWLAAVAVVAGPLCYLIGGVFEPAAHAAGQATIAANATANPATNTTHLIAFVIASFLLPVGVVALAYLARQRTPWLAVLGGVLGVLGWLPFSALTALDDLAVDMTHVPDGGSVTGLWDLFAFDGVMSSYLMIYILGHLVAYVLLGIALHRAAVIPGWAAVAMIASSPMMIVAFVLPGSLQAAGLGVAAASVVLLIIGSLPAARALLAAGRPAHVRTARSRADGSLTCGEPVSTRRHGRAPTRHAERPL